MKKLFFILIFFHTTLLSPEKVQAFDCMQAATIPTIELSTSYGNLKYDHSKNNQQITDIAAKHGISEKGLFASGLATTNVSWEIAVNTIGKIYTNYDICVVPTSIKVFIGFSDPTIYISNQIIKDSCEYNVVLRHEQTHQQINKAALDYFLPMFHRALKQIVKTISPEHISVLTEIDNSTTRLTQKYNSKLAPLIEAFKQELLTEQSKLDNHKNYNFEQNICQTKD